MLVDPPLRRGLVAQQGLDVGGPQPHVDVPGVLEDGLTDHIASLAGGHLVAGATVDRPSEREPLRRAQPGRLDPQGRLERPRLPVHAAPPLHRRRREHQRRDHEGEREHGGDADREPSLGAA
jgi:hypothetical protein